MSGPPPPPPPPPPASAPPPSTPPPSISWQAPGAAPASATAPGVPPASPAPRRKRWLVVLVGVLALIVLIGGAGTVLFATRTWPPLSATYEFTDDISDGDVNEAFAQVCDRLRTEGSRDSFEQFARELGGARSIDVNILSVDRSGDTATVDVTAHYRDDDALHFELKLVNEDGDWRPCGARRTNDRDSD